MSVPCKTVKNVPKIQGNNNKTMHCCKLRKITFFLVYIYINIRFTVIYYHQWVSKSTWILNTTLQLRMNYFELDHWLTVDWKGFHFCLVTRSVRMLKQDTVHISCIFPVVPLVNWGIWKLHLTKHISKQWGCSKWSNIKYQ